MATVRSSCGCSFPLSHITETSLLCHTEGSSSGRDGPLIPTRSYVTFRAKLLSTEVHSADSLMQILETWASSAPLLRDETGSGPEMKLTPDCPLRLRKRSEPLCSGREDVDRTLMLPRTQRLEMNQTDPVTDCITLPIFVSSLAAEFLFLLSVFLVAIMVTLLTVSNKRDRK